MDEKICQAINEHGGSLEKCVIPGGFRVWTFFRVHSDLSEHPDLKTQHVLQHLSPGSSTTRVSSKP